MNIFKEEKHKLKFERDGYITFPLLDEEEVRNLIDYYNKINILEKSFGFQVSVNRNKMDLNIQLRDTIIEKLLPKLDLYLKNYKAFIATFMTKDSSPDNIVHHQDWSFVEEGKGFYSVSAWVALVDTTIENGCMAVLKGSHRLFNNHRPSPSPQSPVFLGEYMKQIFPYMTPVEMKAGEVLIFNNRLIHGSPPNKTANIRYAVTAFLTHKDAHLVHYTLKPNGLKDTLIKYAVDKNFYFKYSNDVLSKFYESEKNIEEYEIIDEIEFKFRTLSLEKLLMLIKTEGNIYNEELGQTIL